MRKMGKRKSWFWWGMGRRKRSGSINIRHEELVRHLWGNVHQAD